VREQEFLSTCWMQAKTRCALGSAKHIVDRRSARFDPEKFGDHYETALVDHVNRNGAGKPITTTRQERGRPDGGAPAPREAAKPESPQPGKETAKDAGQPEGDADVDRW
jgi:DNA end-binding protein Ku